MGDIYNYKRMTSQISHNIDTDMHIDYYNKMISQISHNTDMYNYKTMNKSKDFWNTSKELALMHINMIPIKYNQGFWIDCCGNGNNAYFNNFP